MTDFFELLLAGNNLSAVDMQKIMRACMKGELSEVQIGVFLALMRVKGETTEELKAAATVMLELAHCIDLGDDLIDIVGTGGDGKNTFNVSTASSIVAAAAGAKVAKHGNRSVSSRSGSSDLLTQAGIELHLSDKQLKESMQKNNLCFLFAPHFHQAMQHARAARQQLGIRSLFNLLGPLINPARVKKQVVGVFDKRWQEPLLQVLIHLGSERSMIVTSRDGMDEVSIADKTDVLEYQNHAIKSWEINPADYGCYHASLDDVIVTSPVESLAIINKVFAGEKGAARDLVLLNTSLALYCANIADSVKDGMERAAAAIDNGAAKHCFEQLAQINRGR